MKATGIVRRIDDLGRVVVPKEIRRTLRIREGDPLEIFIDHGGEIVLKKYSPIGEIGIIAQQYADVTAKTLGRTVCISYRDHIIAVAGAKKKDILGKEIDKDLEKLITDRGRIFTNKEDKKYISIVKDNIADVAYEIIHTIISEGDAIGSVILLSEENNPMGELEEKSAGIAAEFIGRQMEA